MDGKRAEWPVIGIDLGTTYSCVAVWKNNRATIISNDRGNRTTPSWVGFTNLDRNIGEPAVLQASTNTVNTVYDAKRLLGKKFSDDSVQKDIKFWPFKVVDGGDDKPVVSVTYMGEHKKLIPEEISAMVLSKMKGIAEDFLGTTVKNAIVTVPAYFNDSQLRATKDAGTIAGLNVIQIINEPTAAAIAYGLDNNMLDGGHSTLLWWKNNSARKNVLVFDLGGGTFDVSLVAMEKGDIKVEAVRGDSHLGGADFDNRMVSEFVGEFKRKHKKDISQNPRAIGRLRAAAERAKRDLSAVLETQVVVDSLFEGIDFSTKITRARFEKLNMDMFRQCMETVDICLKDAGMEKSDVHELVLVGGSSRIPKIQQMLRELFGGKELCKGIHPDEAVAYGAAVHAANLSGVGTSNKDMKLVDVTPLSLGCENVDSECVVMIPRNTTIPVKKNKQWQTLTDNCTNALFNVYEGERQMAKDNNFLDGFTLTGFPLAPKGEIKFDLCFEIDLDGILNVSAVELSSGLRKQITIMHQRGRLSEKEIDRMVREGEKYKAQDEKRMKDVKAKDELEMYANKVSDDTTQLKISEYELEQLHDVIDETSKWLDRNSAISTAAECKKKLEAVQIICRRFGSKLLLR